MMNSVSVRGIMAAGVCSTLICTAAAHAQTVSQDARQQTSPAGEPSAAPETPSTGDIIVTAERRTSTVQSTPIAMVALSGDLIATQRIDTVSQLPAFVPGLTVASHGFSGGQAVLAIRGIGNANLIGDPTVAFHVDGQYFSLGRALNGTFFDLERVEVLKGPQGTLYGRNSTAGVVNVITAKPENYFDANATLAYGNYNHVGVQGMINVPIVDEKLAARLAVNYVRHDGYQKSKTPGVQDIDDANDLALRGSLRFTPTETLAIQLTVETFNIDKNGSGYQALNNPYVPADQFDPFTNYFNTNGYNKQKSASYRGTVSWDMGRVSLNSLTAYKVDRLDQLTDQDGNNVQVSTAERHFRQTAFQQELRLTNSNPGVVDWQVGAFYYRENTQEKFYVDTDLVPTPGQPPVPPFTLINPAGQIDPAFALRIDPHIVKNETFAIYTHDKVHINDQLTLTLGARYNYDKKSRHRTDTNGTVDKSANFNSFIWKAGIDWRPDRNNLIYASVGTGFKAGGTNEGANVPNFDPEKITAYEVGTKSTFAGGRVRLNTAAFYYDYSDLQVSVIQNNQSLTQNAASAKVWGLEMDGHASLTDRLSFDVSATYVHSKMGQLALACPMTAPPTCPGIPGFFPTGNGTIDVTGNPLAQSPRFTFTLGGKYVVPVWDGNLTTSVNYSHSSTVLTQVYADVPPFTLLRQGPVGQLSGSVRYETGDEKWFAELYMDNITDVRQLGAGFVVPPSAIFGSYAPPRTYGARVGWRFR
ncbi:TonB-dependent receptor [Novosphingobium sp. RL4]|uniref:TonB-dependent receptor n=1 Tax=Novosphingobium sp. RL4 TaxID=3109595 RepID=UPI002D771F6A|nr:TonB-dependent receptor [Novosphingobium sp. RL4]WRT94439.1 TonB-dependent receptor [Novosphingobium sp. RL4]